MGAFKLIAERKYEEFCRLYEEKGQGGEGDLMPGNYVMALLGARRFRDLVSFCREQIGTLREKSVRIDRSSSLYFLGESIGLFELGDYPAALQALREGSKAAYQDLSRTQVPGILYYEATVLGDKKAKGESKRLLNTRLRNKDLTSPDFGVAAFLAGKRPAGEALERLDTLPPILRERRKVQALFYMAVKALEEGDRQGYARHLQEACALYHSASAVVMEFEYHLAELCRERL